MIISPRKAVNSGLVHDVSNGVEYGRCAPSKSFLLKPEQHTRATFANQTFGFLSTEKRVSV